MEIRVLRYFLEIARAGNMTRAAETLHVSQPTLSKQMKDLAEKEVDEKEVQRSWGRNYLSGRAPVSA